MIDLISVVIPNYNNGEFIKECIESVVNQTYPNIEIIIIDDFSTDNSINEIESVDLKGRTLKLIENKNNGFIRQGQHGSLIHCQRVSYSRNIGIKESRGKYVSTLDSDDLFIDPMKLELEHKSLQVDDNIIAYSNISMIDENSKIKSIVGNKNTIKEGNISIGILNRNIFIPRDFLCKKTHYMDVGLYDESLKIYEDWDLKIRLSLMFKFKFSGSNGVGYRRIIGRGLSSLPADEQNFYIQKIINKYVGKVK